MLFSLFLNNFQIRYVIIVNDSYDYDYHPLILHYRDYVYIVNHHPYQALRLPSPLIVRRYPDSDCKMWFYSLVPFHKAGLLLFALGLVQHLILLNDKLQQLKTLQTKTNPHHTT